MDYHEPFLFCLWKRDGEWEFRIDPARIPTGKKHIHIRRIRNGKGEYSWNIDGTRHDKHAFPANERDIKRAKEIAATRLKIDVSTLQFLAATEPGDTTIFLDGNGMVLEALLWGESLLVLSDGSWLIFCNPREETSEPDLEIQNSESLDEGKSI